MPARYRAPHTDTGQRNRFSQIVSTLLFVELENDELFSFSSFLFSFNFVIQHAQFSFFFSSSRFSLLHKTLFIFLAAFFPFAYFNLSAQHTTHTYNSRKKYEIIYISYIKVKEISLNPTKCDTFTYSLVLFFVFYLSQCIH